MPNRKPLADRRSIPTGVRAGVGTIVFGVLLDLSAHTTGVSVPSGSSAGQHLAHLVVVLGMLLVLVAIVRDGMSTSSRVVRLDRSSPDAVR